MRTYNVPGQTSIRPITRQLPEQSSRFCVRWKYRINMVRWSLIWHNYVRIWLEGAHLGTATWRIEWDGSENAHRGGVIHANILLEKTKCRLAEMKEVQHWELLVLTFRDAVLLRLEYGYVLRTCQSRKQEEKEDVLWLWNCWIYLVRLSSLFEFFCSVGFLRKKFALLLLCREGEYWTVSCAMWLTERRSLPWLGMRDEGTAIEKGMSL